ncbi:unnamed protein product [Arctia plantaginis]|uniref:Uncharacterized protein n=1 Tax=Arctia plantaginis TaxID=874455 RepID=A0A8S1A1H1_ARCPL|nr:unnamed protein product [Arctia plantaginis]
MDFLSGLVEVGLYGSKSSTLFAGAAGNETIDREWLEENRNSNTLKVSLEQSSFDNNQSKTTILAVLIGMEQHILLHASVPYEYRVVWNTMWETLIIAGPSVYSHDWRYGHWLAKEERAPKAAPRCISRMQHKQASMNVRLRHSHTPLQHSGS